MSRTITVAYAEQNGFKSGDIILKPHRFQRGQVKTDRFENACLENLQV